MSAPLFDRLEFWKDPAANTSVAPKVKRTCCPEFYLDLVNITDLVVDTISQYCNFDDEILEIGCGTGRNLVGLHKAGFRKLQGVEISKKTVYVGQAYFPEYKDIPVTISPIEDIINELPVFDAIFTQGCLMHLPLDLDWVIEKIAQKAKHLLFINEGEVNSYHAWLRDYRKIIESYGWVQVEQVSGENCPPLQKHTIKRVFVRKDIDRGNDG